MKRKHVVNKCSQQGPRRCSARIASKAKSHANMVELGHDVGSKCSKDTCGESLPCLKSDGKQTSSYVPSLEGDDNSDELQDDVEFLMEVQPINLKLQRDLCQQQHPHLLQM